MRYSGNHGSGLEYLVGNSYSGNHSNVNYYLAKNLENRHAIYRHTDDTYAFSGNNAISFDSPHYNKVTSRPQYTEQKYFTAYFSGHAFTPKIMLEPSRPKAKFIDDDNEAKAIAGEIFELMMKEKMPNNISISILPFDEFKILHSRFGAWSNGILGFSLNGADKRIFIKENHLDSLMLVIGHEIGHVFTKSLPNRHDEEAKAFAFSVEWAKTIKKHNVANLGLSIKNDIDFQPARNGLHDIAFSFVDFMVKKGRNAMQLHDDLAKKYMSIFNVFY